MTKKDIWDQDLNDFLGSGKKKTKKKTKRRVFKDDFNKLMDKQKGLCANKNCAKHHGTRQKVTTTRDIDHIIPIKLWELKGLKGNPNRLSNLQLLCPDCHRRKTANDRKKIALYKEKHGSKSNKGKKDIWDMSLDDLYKQ